MSQELKEAGYDTQLMKRRTRSRKLRGFLKSFAVILVVAGLGALAADYLARLPRERHAMHFNYAKRVWLGVQKAVKAAVLTVQSYQDDPKSSKLPIVELYIKGKRLDKLNESLPESGSKFQKAKVKLENEIFSAEVRYRGDSINHWAFPNKSWRIQLRKGKQYDGMNVINLAVPRTETQLSNWLGYQIVERFGDVLLPEANFVHFRLNRRYDGVRLFLEQPDQEFLRRRNLPYGKIFVGDIDSAQIYGGEKRKLLYQDPTAWSVRSPVEDASTAEIEDLISIIKNENTPYRFYYAMNELVDMRSLLKYMAMLEMVGSVHVDETHNGKFYFHPAKGKFMPIAWDTVAYMWKDSKGLDSGANSLFRTVLSNPEYRERKDRYLWNALHGSLAKESVEKLIKDAARKLRPDIYSFPLKIAANDKGLRHISNSEWEDNVKELLKVVDQRQTRIAGEFEATEVAYRLRKPEQAISFSDESQGLKNQGLGGNAQYLLGVQVKSRSGFRLDTLELATDAPDGTEVMIVRRGLDDLLHAIKPEELVRKAVVKNGEVKFSLGDALYSKRKFSRKKGAEVVPSNYVYLLSLGQVGGSLGTPKLSGTNSITGKRATPVEDQNYEVPLAHRANIVWWEPTRFTQRTERALEGRVHLRKDLIVEGYENLKIAPGTEVLLDPGVSIIVKNGSIFAEGTEENPIVIRGATDAKPWGVVAVHDGALSRFHHVQVVGGSEDHFKHVRYSGAISIHGGSAEIIDTSLNGSFLSVNDAEVKLSRVEVQNVLPFYVQSERSVLRQEDVNHTSVPALHRISNLQKPAFGTPARAEREYKWTVNVGNSDISLEELSSGILEALRLSIGDEKWQAPKYTGNSYYVDQEVKDFAFRDIYFDTPDNLNYRNNLSYRLRNRYSNRSGYKIHVKSPGWTGEWPYRLEYQAKFGREELGDGFSTVDEARFEFRKESKPFSEENLPPPPPWDLDEFIPYFEAGEFKGLQTLPAKEVMEFYQGKGVQAKELSFSPRLVL